MHSHHICRPNNLVQAIRNGGNILVLALLVFVISNTLASPVKVNVTEGNLPPIAGATTASQGFFSTLLSVTATTAQATATQTSSSNAKSAGTSSGTSSSADFANEVANNYVFPGSNITYSASGKLPAQVLNLRSFMVNLPINSAGSLSGFMSWVKNPSLSFYANPYFYVDSATGGVVFLSPVKGATSPGSPFTRCELRELSPGTFSSSDGKTHALNVDLSVDAIPRASSVCVAQIWGPSSSFFMIRAFADGSFWVVITGSSGMPQQLKRVPSGTVNPKSRFSIAVSLSSNVLKTTLSQAGKGSWSNTMTLPRAVSGLHMKAGAYCQTTGNNEACKVTMYSLRTTHQ